MFYFSVFGAAEKLNTKFLFQFTFSRKLLCLSLLSSLHLVDFMFLFFFVKFSTISDNDRENEDE